MAEDTETAEKPVPKLEDIKTIGVLFPGQGNQYKGMGRQLCKQNAAACKVYQTFHTITGMPYEDLFLEGKWRNRNILMGTVAYSVALYEVRKELEEKEGLEPKVSEANFYAGMSAGEVPALFAGGAFENLRAFVELVYKRSQNLDKIVYDGSCMMRLSRVNCIEELEDICSNMGTEIGLWNAPDTFVLTGEPEGIQNLGRTVFDIGKNKLWRPIELEVKRPYHSSLLRNVAEKWWRKVLVAFHLKRMRCPVKPVVANVTGELYEKDDDIVELLEQQFYNRVLWCQTMMKWVFGKDAKDGSSLATQGMYPVDAVIEIGPKARPNKPGGGSLSSLLKRFPYQVPILHLTNESQLRNTKLVYSRPV